MSDIDDENNDFYYCENYENTLEKSNRKHDELLKKFDVRFSDTDRRIPDFDGSPLPREIGGVQVS